MGILSNLFTKEAGDLAGTIGGVVDNLSTSDDEKSAAKAELTNVVLGSLNRLQEAQKEVLVTELKGNWLQRSWRPILMMTFGAILVCKWFGWTDANIDHELEIKLMDIVQLGLGGYVIGRSAEKIAGTVTQNIDMPFLKKKDRK